MLKQRTLKQIARTVGIGLHSGTKVELVLRPAAAEWVEEVAAAIKQPRRTKRRVLSTMSNLQPKPSSCSNRP